MKSGHGSFSTKRTTDGETIWTSFTLLFSSVALAPLYRSNVNFTSSAVTGVPSWNLTPLRMLNVYVRWSFDSDHDSARLGVMRPPGIGFTSASCTAYMTMYGVLNASASPGSSHFAGSVTWSPHRISPSAARAGAGRTTTATRARTMRTRSGGRTVDVVMGETLGASPVTVKPRRASVSRGGCGRRSAARGGA